MAKQTANRAALYYKAETNWGETPAGGAFSAIRYTGESLDRDKNTTKSNFIRADRMIDDNVLLGFGVQGDIDIEWAYGAFDTLIEHAMCSTFSNVALVALTLTVASGAKTITRSAGSWISDGVVIGGAVKFGGFTTPANNARFTVSAMTATVLTVLDPGAVLVTEGPTAACTATQKSVLVGTLTPSLVIEKQFLDITKFMYFNGVRVSGLSLDIVAQQLITGKFSFMGKDAVAGVATVTGSLVAANSTSSMSASTNVGTVCYGGAALSAGLKSIKFDLSNDLRKQDIVGSQATGGIAYGSFGCKGSIEGYYEDQVLLTDIIAHNTVALNFTTTDAAGNAITFNFPAVKLTKGSPKAGGINQDIMLPMEFEAIRDPLSNSMLVISK